MSVCHSDLHLPLVLLRVMSSEMKFRCALGAVMHKATESSFAIHHHCVMNHILPLDSPPALYPAHRVPSSAIVFLEW